MDMGDTFAVNCGIMSMFRKREAILNSYNYVMI